MVTTATIEQTKTVTGGGQYQIASEITSAVSMPIEVFVYKAVSGAYDHVATMFDMQAYPTTATVNIAFFRTADVIQVFDTPDEANSAAAVHLTRVNDLVLQFVNGGGVFDGTPVVTVLDGT